MAHRLAQLATAVAAAGLAAAGCGGGEDDEQEARQTVRQFVEATNQRDADRFCGELVTREFLEQTTGATGDNARDTCKRQLRSLKGLRVDLVRIERVSVEGDEATVRTVLATRGSRTPQVFRLEKEDGEWRMAGRTAP